MNDIWYVQFIVVDTVGKRFLAGDKQMQTITIFLVGLPTTKFHGTLNRSAHRELNYLHHGSYPGPPFSLRIERIAYESGIDSSLSAESFLRLAR